VTAGGANGRIARHTEAMRTGSFGALVAWRTAATMAVVMLIVVACRTTTLETATPMATANTAVESPAATAPDEAGSLPPPVTKTMCQSGEDLADDVATLRALDVSEDGAASLIAGVDTALAEAKMLADLVVDEYQPLVEDTVVALQDLRDVGQELQEVETLGAGVATIGAAITEVGVAMDALETQLRAPCPQQVS
jgi:hypothetical protein